MYWRTRIYMYDIAYSEYKLNHMYCIRSLKPLIIVN